MNNDTAHSSILKGELIRDTIEGSLYRVLYVSASSGVAYWIRVDSSSNIPKPIELNILNMKLNTRCYEAVIDNTHTNVNSEASQAMISERDRIFGLIKDLICQEPDIYESRSRSSLLHSHEKLVGVSMNKLYIYLGRYWRGGMKPDALLPRYGNRGKSPKEINYNQRTGRHKKEGENGKIITQEDKKNFAKAIKEYYSKDDKPTLYATYNWMIAHMYSIPHFEGDTHPIQLPPDQKPSFRQFTYWHTQNKDFIKEQKSREKNRYDLKCRGGVDSSDTFVKGPGMVVQIDATIADYYLVREHHRDEIVGRPVMFFIKDVKTRMITGMYVTLENTSWDCALMALKNSCEDKVSFCKRYGIDITPQQWPCCHLPVSITADNGEMGDKGVEEIIAKLGITIENAPPYRGDLKGIIEKNFDMVDMKLRYIVPGHVDKNDGERGSINRKKEACIDIRTFIQMIIRCVLYYNNYHWMETYERSPEMMQHGIKPIPRDLWIYGMQFQSGALRIVSKEDIYKILLPREKASVTDRGILFRELYYTCAKARKESWYDKSRMTGRWQIPITYDPTCLDHIYISEENGSLIQCDLLSKSSFYQGFSEEDMEEIKKRDEEEKARWSQEEEMARTNIILELEILVKRCQNEKKDGGASAAMGVLEKHKVSKQRQAEKEEQSGETAAKDAQEAETGTKQGNDDAKESEATYETAGDAMDSAIDEALKAAGLL